jgi:hypothetical protein
MLSPLQRHRPLALFSGPLDFGIAWGSVLMVVAFIFYRGLLMHATAQGLWVDFFERKCSSGFREPVEKTLWAYTEIAKVDFPRERAAGGPPVAATSKLQAELGKRMVWTVYFEADKRYLVQGNGLRDWTQFKGWVQRLFG